MPYLKLNYVIKELSTSLAEQDIDALLAFITGPKPQAFGDMEWGSLTNDIQEALSVQTMPNEKVAKALIATYRDESRGQLMRDYALQHVGGFAMYLVHTSGTRIEPLPSFYPSLVAELKSAAADSSKPWAGTALNLLDGVLRASEERGVANAGISVEELIRLAVPVAKDSQAPLNARLPALQVASRRQSPEALELARQILADPDSHLMLVQSACAVVGQQGTAQDVALLEKLQNQDSRHKSPAARAALDRLRASSVTH
jgi:hypothetical protein